MRTDRASFTVARTSQPPSETRKVAASTPRQSARLTESGQLDPAAQSKEDVKRWIGNYFAGMALLGLGIGVVLFAPEFALYGAGAAAVALAGANLYANASR